MTVQANLSYQKFTIDEGVDSVVVVKDLADLPGGKVLDVSGVTGVERLNAGHVIMCDATGNYSPLAVVDGAYTTSTTGLTYAGVLKKSIGVGIPMAAILTAGQVRKAACPYEVTPEIEAGLTHIQFI